MTAAQDLPPVLDSEGAAKLLFCAQKTVEERCRIGDLPGEKFGDGWAIPTFALLQRVNEISIEKMLERRAAAEKPVRPNLVQVGRHNVERQPPPLQ